MRNEGKCSLAAILYMCCGVMHNRFATSLTRIACLRVSKISTIRIRPAHRASRTNQVVDVAPICSSHDACGSRGWLTLPKLSFITRGIETDHTVFTRAGISPRATHRGKSRATRSDRSSKGPSPAVSALRLRPSDLGEGTQSQLTERTKNESR
jgi:hypothetical protein